MEDTSRNPCLLLAQRACGGLRRALTQKTAARGRVPKQAVSEAVGSVESAVMILLYSYQPGPERELFAGLRVIMP